MKKDLQLDLDFNANDLLIQYDLISSPGAQRLKNDGLKIEQQISRSFSWQ